MKRDQVIYIERMVRLFVRRQKLKQVVTAPLLSWFYSSEVIFALVPDCMQASKSRILNEMCHSSTDTQSQNLSQYNGMILRPQELNNISKPLPCV